MSDETKCPGCGAEQDNVDAAYFNWKCGSQDIGGFVPSDRCRITQLEQQLSVAVEALEMIRSKRYPFNTEPRDICLKLRRIAAEALKKIGSE